MDQSLPKIPYEALSIKDITENLSIILKTLSDAKPLIQPPTSNALIQTALSDGGGGSSSTTTTSITTTTVIATNDEEDNKSIVCLPIVKKKKSKESLKNVEESNRNSSSNGNNNTRPHDSFNLDHHLEILRIDLQQIKATCNSLGELEKTIGKSVKELHSRISVALKALETEDSLDGIQQIERFSDEQILELSRDVRKLKHRITLWHRADTTSDTNHHHRTRLRRVACERRFEDVQDSVFRDFSKCFQCLDRRSKICLLCFALFPENAVLKKRLLIYWWVGEGLIESTDDRQPAEEVADRILKQLVEKGFIEPVNKMCGLVMDSFRISPQTSPALMKLANLAGFSHFDRNGKPIEETKNFRACLVEKTDSDRKEFTDAYIRTLFNFDNPYPDVKLDISKMRNLNILYLGSWNRALAEYHIEVDSTKFLEGLKDMKDLRLISLQGISRINELPEAVCGLPNLRILDLRACHNLEEIPNGIACLKKLTHLDTSECYLLDHMPKGLSSLTELQVLKGFVLADKKKDGEKKKGSPCTLSDLKVLTKLRKLSIHTGIAAFPRPEEVDVLRKFKELRKLKIAWGYGSPTENSKSEKKPKQEGKARTISCLNTFIGRGDAAHQANNAGAAATAEQAVAATEAPNICKNLEKLDLACFPHRAPPGWLKPGNLEKLYIRGGELKNLGQSQDQIGKWKVKILRLKFMDDFKLSWRQWQESFPDLIYLEKVQCPKLTLYPCNEYGVWVKD